MKTTQWLIVLIALTSFSLLSMSAYLISYRVKTDKVIIDEESVVKVITEEIHNPKVRALLRLQQKERDTYVNLVKALDKTSLALSAVIFVLSISSLFCVYAKRKG